MKNIAAEIAGQTFGRLTVERRVGSSKHGKAVWSCRCSCGSILVADTGALRSGNTTSCGCYSVDNPRSCTHRKSGTPEHRAWKKLRERCNNPNVRNYPDYGGRGISVHHRWESFENFYKDMGPRPSAGHSIDRIDNSGGYGPGNCRWATRVEQNRNTRRNKMYCLNGETKCLASWAQSAGLTTDFLKKRLYAGWPLGLALTARKNCKLASIRIKAPEVSPEG